MNNSHEHANFIQYGSIQINFLLEFSNRKSLGITVTPDLNVLVKAPEGSSIEDVKQKIIKKAQWILKQQNFFRSFFPKMPKRNYVSGETHLYLGRQYRLSIINHDCRIEEDCVQLKGGFIIVKTREKSEVEKLVKTWYRKKAEQKISEIAWPLIHSFTSRYKLSDCSFQLNFREMPTRWGSCTHNGKIILNPELIKAPRGCIEYVIIHELCHLIHHNHTRKFMDLQSKEMRDWETWKLRLEHILA